MAEAYAGLGDETKAREILREMLAESALKRVVFS